MRGMKPGRVVPELFGGLGKTANYCQRLVAAAGCGQLSVVKDILEDHPRKVPN